MTNNELRQTNEYNIIRTYGYNDSEAISALIHGTSVYNADDWENNYESYYEEWFYGGAFYDSLEMEKEKKEMKEIIEKQKSNEWWDIVTYLGKKYYINWAR